MLDVRRRGITTPKSPDCISTHLLLQEPGYYVFNNIMSLQHIHTTHVHTAHTNAYNILHTLFYSILLFPPPTRYRTCSSATYIGLSVIPQQWPPFYQLRVKQMSHFPFLKTFPCTSRTARPYILRSKGFTEISIANRGREERTRTRGKKNSLKTA